MLLLISHEAIANETHYIWVRTKFRILCHLFVAILFISLAGRFVIELFFHCSAAVVDFICISGYAICADVSVGG